MQLAGILGGDLPDGRPAVKYRIIPRGKRGCHRHASHERHCQLWDEPRVADELVAQRDLIVALGRDDQRKLSSPTQSLSHCRRLTSLSATLLRVGQTMALPEPVPAARGFAAPSHLRERRSGATSSPDSRSCGGGAEPFVAPACRANQERVVRGELSRGRRRNVPRQL